MASDERAQLTVSALIERLQAVLAEQGDIPVIIEGCDCSGDAATVQTFPFTRHHLVPETMVACITRTDSPTD